MKRFKAYRTTSTKASSTPPQEKTTSDPGEKKTPKNTNGVKINFTSFLLFYLPQDHPLFMRLRNSKGYLISGSSLANVFAVGYTSRPKFWRIMKGLEKEQDFPHPAKEYGKVMEPISRRAFMQCFVNDRPDDSTYTVVEVGNKALALDYRFGASPDGLIKDFLGQLLEGLELKNPFSKAIPLSVEMLMTEDYIGHVLQCILNMEVFNVDIWNLFYYRDSTKEKAWFRIKRNKEFFLNVLYREAIRFINLAECPIRVPKNFKEKWISDIAKNMDIIKVEV
jgi:hypothetical protein